MSVLFLAHRIPFPPDRGDKIRSHHLLRAIARLEPVHIACFADTASEMAHEGEIAALAQSYCLVRRHKSINLAGVQAILQGKAISLPAFYDRQIATYVDAVIKEFRIDTIFVYSGQMAQYVPQDFAGRLVIDFVDMDSEKFANYSAQASGPMRMVYAREAKKLRAFEIACTRRAEISTFVSQNEADLFTSYAPDNAAKVRALRNGIDCTHYDPRSVSIITNGSKSSDHDIVFTGQMDYPPNVEAVCRFATKMLPRIKELHPDARFVIVGRQPTEEVKALHDGEHVIVTGEVDDVRPWLLAARIVVAPLAVARGVQNKVLEAMAMERPVFTSKQAATGIDAKKDEHFIIAEDDEDMISQINALFANGKKLRAIGIAARRHVQDNMSWDAMLSDLPAMLTGSDQQQSAGQG